MSHNVQGYGVISVYLPNGKMRQIHDVMYVLGIKNNLISVSTITDNKIGRASCRERVSSPV